LFRCFTSIGHYLNTSLGVAQTLSGPLLGPKKWLKIHDGSFPPHAQQ
jgi:hypothetical protein